MVFSKTNKKRSISSKGSFYETNPDGKFLCSRHLNDALKKKQHLCTYANFKATFPLLYYFYEKSTVVQFSWHTFNHVATM